MKSFAVNLNPTYSITLNTTTQTTTGQYFLATITGEDPLDRNDVQTAAGMGKPACTKTVYRLDCPSLKTWLCLLWQLICGRVQCRWWWQKSASHGVSPALTHSAPGG